MGKISVRMPPKRLLPSFSPRTRKPNRPCAPPCHANDAPTAKRTIRGHAEAKMRGRAKELPTHRKCKKTNHCKLIERVPLATLTTNEASDADTANTATQVPKRHNTKNQKNHPCNHKIINQITIHMVLPCERLPFADQKVTSCKAKRNLSQANSTATTKQEHRFVNYSEHTSTPKPAAGIRQATLCPALITPIPTHRHNTPRHRRHSPCKQEKGQALPAPPPRHSGQAMTKAANTHQTTQRASQASKTNVKCFLK